MRHIHKFFYFTLCSAALLTSCGKKEVIEETVRVKVPVTITNPVMKQIGETMTLTATSSYQRKNIVAAALQGYIVEVNVNVGDHIAKGAPLFVLQTKESHALNHTALPDSLKIFSGKITILAPSSGIITSIMRQSGDYIQDGEQLCTIADIGSFGFTLNVPYDNIRFVRIGESCDLVLQDSTRLQGRITKKLATVDAASQTQNYLIVLNSAAVIPENVIAQVELSTNEKKRALTLAKGAVLADETMQHFWVMQLLNDSTAVKVEIEKGIESESSVEILSPVFSTQDRIVLTGNYGMEDSALVKISQ